jgi:hypothetical protein
MADRIEIFTKKDRIKKKPEDLTNEEAFAVDWTRKCQVCEQTPVVNATGLCGPCTFGEAATIGGNW